jgi:hypothetical protein
MNGSLLNVIKQITAKEGVSILTDARRVSAMLMDIAKDVPRPQKLSFVKCLEHQAVQAFQSESEGERRNIKQKLAKKINEEEGLDIKLCEETLDILAAVLYETITAPVKPAVPEPKSYTPPIPLPASAPAAPDSTLWSAGTSSSKYLHTSYDFIDNGAGELMLVMDAPPGDVDEINARFIYNKAANEGLLVRAKDQIMHLSIVPDAVAKMLLNGLKKVLVTEMYGKDIIDDLQITRKEKSVKKVKLFLTSSLKELDRDLEELGAFIGDLNDRYESQGIYFQLAVSGEGGFEEDVKSARESELFYIIFHEEPQDQARAEFDAAYKAFKEKKSPRIVTYYKQVGDQGCGSALAFMEKLRSELGYFNSKYAHMDTIKLNFMLQLKSLGPAML